MTNNPPRLSKQEIKQITEKIRNQPYKPYYQPGYKDPEKIFQEAEKLNCSDSVWEHNPELARRVRLMLILNKFRVRK